MVGIIRIAASDIQVIAELNDTMTAEAILQAPPIKARANLWEEEICFPIPASLEPDEGQEVVK